MRLLKTGVSAVVAMSFVLFLFGMAFAEGIMVSGEVQTLPLITGQPTPLPGATVRLVGTQYTDTTGPDDTLFPLVTDGDYWLSVPINELPPTFLLKVTKSQVGADVETNYVPTYTIPSGGESGGIDDFDIFLLSETDLASFYNTATGSAQVAGASTLMVMTYDPNVITEAVTVGSGLVYGASAIIRDSNGNNVTGSYTVRYIQSTDGINVTLATSPDDTVDTGTFGYVVFNLPVGSYTVSASLSGSTFGFRPAFTFADSVTVGSNPETGVILAQGTVSGTGYLIDETEAPVSGAVVRLIGGAGNFNDNTNDIGAFDYTGVPYFSAGCLKATKDNYVPTYAFQIIEEPEEAVDGAEGDTFTIISTAALNQVVEDTGVDTISGQGHIIGFIRDSYGNPVKGAYFVFYDENGNPLPEFGVLLLPTNPQVFYMVSTPGDVLVDPLLGRTSDSGGFIILNLDPEKLFYLRVRVPSVLTFTGYESPLYLASTFADSISISNFRLDEIQKGNLELATGANNPDTSVVPAGSLGVVMLQFALTETTGKEEVNLGEVIITNSGTGNAADVTAVKLYYDFNGNGEVDSEPGIDPAGDILLGSGTFGTDGKITFISGGSILPNSTRNFLVVYDFDNLNVLKMSIAGGDTFRASIEKNSDITAIGDDTNYAISVNGAPVAGGLKWIFTEGKHLGVDPVSYDFGTVAVGESSDQKTVTIISYGDTEVGITSVVQSGDTEDFTVTEPAIITLSPGGTEIRYVTFTPGSGGDKTLTLTINSDAVENPLIVTFTGTGISTYDSSTGDFGSLPVGPLAAGISAFLVWWKRRKQRQE